MACDAQPMALRVMIYKGAPGKEESRMTYITCIGIVAPNYHRYDGRSSFYVVKIITLFMYPINHPGSTDADKP